jgi:hypothetical protein
MIYHAFNATLRPQDGVLKQLSGAKNGDGLAGLFAALLDGLTNAAPPDTLLTRAAVVVVPEGEVPVGGEGDTDASESVPLVTGFVPGIAKNLAGEPLAAPPVESKAVPSNEPGRVLAARHEPFGLVVTTASTLAAAASQETEGVSAGVSQGRSADTRTTLQQDEAAVTSARPSLRTPNSEMSSEGVEEVASLSPALRELVRADRTPRTTVRADAVGTVAETSARTTPVTDVAAVKHVEPETSDAPDPRSRGTNASAKPAAEFAVPVASGDAGKLAEPLSPLVAKLPHVGDASAAVDAVKPVGEPVSARGLPEVEVQRVGDFVLKSIRQSEGGERTIRVQLVPESLGEVRIVIRQSGESLDVVLTARLTATREVLEQHVHALRDALAGDGFDSAKVSVQVSTNGDSGPPGSGFGRFGESGAHGGRGGHAGQGGHSEPSESHARGTPRPARGDSMLDVLA